MRRFILLSLLAVVPLLAVHAGPSPEQMRTANYGKPLPDDYQDTITQFMAGVLKDPYTAHYSFTPIGPVWQKDSLLFGGKMHCGMGVQVMVNAKNSYGAYIGEQEYGFILHNGAIIKMFTPDELQAQHNNLFRKRNTVF